LLHGFHTGQTNEEKGFIGMATAMIVDDAAFMRMALKKILVRLGIEVIAEAENGVSAIQKFKELKPDIITMDITMPEMTGIEALREIHKISSEVRVVMVTAMGQESFVREAVLNGAKDFIVKPFKEETVKATLESVLKSLNG
jgi:two-component system chemotaxis response regulator CheY